MAQILKFQHGGGTFTIDNKKFSIDDDFIHQLSEFGKTLDLDVGRQFQHIIDAAKAGKDLTYNSASGTIEGEIDWNLTDRQKKRMFHSRSKTGSFFGRLNHGKEQDAREAIYALRDFKYTEPKPVGTKYIWGDKRVAAYERNEDGTFKLDENGNKKLIQNDAGNLRILAFLDHLKDIPQYKDYDVFEGFAGNEAEGLGAVDKSLYIELYNKLGPEGVEELKNKIINGTWGEQEEKMLKSYNIWLNPKTKKTSISDDDDVETPKDDTQNTPITSGGTPNTGLSSNLWIMNADGSRSVRDTGLYSLISTPQGLQDVWLNDSFRKKYPQYKDSIPKGSGIFIIDGKVYDGKDLETLRKLPKFNAFVSDNRQTGGNSNKIKQWWSDEHTGWHDLRYNLNEDPVWSPVFKPGTWGRDVTKYYNITTKDGVKPIVIHRLTDYDPSNNDLFDFYGHIKDVNPSNLVYINPDTLEEYTKEFNITNRDIAEALKDDVEEDPYGYTMEKIGDDYYVRNMLYNGNSQWGYLWDPYKNTYYWFDNSKGLGGTKISGDFKGKNGENFFGNYYWTLDKEIGDILRSNPKLLENSDVRQNLVALLRNRFLNATTTNEIKKINISKVSPELWALMERLYQGPGTNFNINTDEDLENYGYAVRVLPNTNPNYLVSANKRGGIIRAQGGGVPLVGGSTNTNRNSKGVSISLTELDPNNVDAITQMVIDGESDGNVYFEEGDDGHYYLTTQKGKQKNKLNINQTQAGEEFNKALSEFVSQGAEWAALLGETSAGVSSMFLNSKKYGNNAKKVMIASDLAADGAQLFADASKYGWNSPITYKNALINLGLSAANWVPGLHKWAKGRFIHRIINSKWTLRLINSALRACEAYGITEGIKAINHAIETGEWTNPETLRKIVNGVRAGMNTVNAYNRSDVKKGYVSKTLMPNNGNLADLKFTKQEYDQLLKLDGKGRIDFIRKKIETINPTKTVKTAELNAEGFPVEKSINPLEGIEDPLAEYNIAVREHGKINQKVRKKFGAQEGPVVGENRLGQNQFGYYETLNFLPKNTSNLYLNLPFIGTGSPQQYSPWVFNTDGSYGSPGYYIDSDGNITPTENNTPPAYKQGGKILKASTGSEQFGDTGRFNGINPDMIGGIADLLVSIGATNKSVNKQIEGVKKGIIGSQQPYATWTSEPYSDLGIRQQAAEAISNIERSELDTNNANLKVADQLSRANTALSYKDKVMQELSNNIRTWTKGHIEGLNRFNEANRQIYADNKKNFYNGLAQIDMLNAGRTQQLAQSYKNLIYQFRQNYAKDLLQRNAYMDKYYSARAQVLINNDIINTFNNKGYIMTDEEKNTYGTDVVAYMRAVHPYDVANIEMKHNKNLYEKIINDPSRLYSWWNPFRKFTFEVPELVDSSTTGKTMESRQPEDSINSSKKGGTISRHRDAGEQQWLDQNKAINKAVSNLNRDVIKLFMKMIS